MIYNTSLLLMFSLIFVHIAHSMFKSIFNNSTQNALKGITVIVSDLHKIINNIHNLYRSVMLIKS